MKNPHMMRMDDARSRRRFLQALSSLGVGSAFLPQAVAAAGALASQDGGMIKMAFCLRRLPHLTREEFQARWFNVHGPLVRERAQILGIRRYVQLHSLDDALSAGVRAPRQSPEPFDGIAELWWDSVEEFAPSQSSPERRQAGAELLEDERKFIDLPRSPVWMARERPVVDG